MLTGSWGPGPRAQGIWAIALVDLILLAFPGLQAEPAAEGQNLASAEECGHPVQTSAETDKGSRAPRADAMKWKETNLMLRNGTELN
jgi:hypothetical protein